VIGSGGFLITEQAEDLDQYYVFDSELVTFNGLSELVVNINRYLNDYRKRDAIALNGHKKTALLHTYEARFTEILIEAEKIILDKKGSKDTIHDIKVCLERFNKEATKHGNINYFLKLLKSALQIPCAVIWGEEKGRRVARRILYEFSWRVVGKKTYTASGLPGRLFYKES